MSQADSAKTGPPAKPEALCESDEYYIVATGSDYGLSNYDHIALNGEDVKENDVVFQ